MKQIFLQKIAQIINFSLILLHKYKNKALFKQDLTQNA